MWLEVCLVCFFLWTAKSLLLKHRDQRDHKKYDDDLEDSLPNYDEMDVREDRPVASASSSSISTDMSNDSNCEDECASNKGIHAHCGKTFQNVGYDNWCRLREKWLSRDATCSEEREHRRPINYDELYDRIRNSGSEMKLSQPVNLSDLIDVYQDVWESGSPFQFAEHALR